MDRGDYDNVSYSLDIATTEGLRLGLFTLVVEAAGGTLLSLLIAPVQGFQEEMESAQASITLDGSGIFEGIDAEVMQGFLDAAVPPDGGTLPPNPLPTVPPAPTAVPTAPALPTLAPTQTATAGGSLVGGINEQLSRGAATEQAGIPTSSPGSTGQSATFPNSYTIPLNGNVVTYSDDWTAIESGQDTVRLANPSLGASVSVLELPDNLPQLADAQSFAASLLETPEFVNSAVVEALTLDDGDRWILVFSEPLADDILYLIYEVVGSETGTTVISISVNEQDLEAAVDLATGTVQVNGKPVFADVKQQVPGIFRGTGF